MMTGKAWCATITLGLPSVDECTFQHYPNYVGDDKNKAIEETWDYLADIWDPDLLGMLEEYIDIEVESY